MGKLVGTCADPLLKKCISKKLMADNVGQLSKLNLIHERARTHTRTIMSRDDVVLTSTQVKVRTYACDKKRIEKGFEILL